MKHFARTLFTTLALALPLTGVSVVPSLAQSAVEAPAGWERFMKTETLNALMYKDLGIQVIDIRSEKYIKKGAIPGAVSIPFKQWRGPSDRPGQPPTSARLAELIGANGLQLDKPIVIHNHSGKTIQSGRAAIVYWILKSAGANDLAILDGGFKAWRAAGWPEAVKPQVKEPTTVEVNYRHDWWAGPMQIFGVTTGQKDGAILDARLDGQVRKAVETGKPLKSMPLAQYIPASFFTQPMTKKGLSAEGKAEFRAGLEARGINLNSEMLISVCQTGELSALSWFYASEILGIDNVLYYPDALQGWESDGGLMFGMDLSTS